MRSSQEIFVIKLWKTLFLQQKVAIILSSCFAGQEDAYKDFSTKDEMPNNVILANQRWDGGAS